MWDNESIKMLGKKNSNPDYYLNKYGIWLTPLNDIHHEAWTSRVFTRAFVIFCFPHISQT